MQRQRRPLSRERWIELTALAVGEAFSTFVKGAGFTFGVIYAAKKTGVLPLKK